MAELESSEPSAARHAPWLLAVVGLILMLIGYGLLNYAPARSADVPDDPQLRRLREMAEKDPAQQAFAERLRDLGRPDRLALLRPAGFVAFYAGLLLFIAAGIRMYRQPPAEKPAEDENLENPHV
jgi:hypothetical protein